MTDRAPAGMSREQQGEQGDGGQPVGLDEVMVAYAKSIVEYHKAEDSFVADPNHRTLWRFHIALDHLVTLRDELSRANRIGSAIAGAAAAGKMAEITEAIMARSEVGPS